MKNIIAGGLLKTVACETKLPIAELAVRKCFGLTVIPAPA